MNFIKRWIIREYTKQQIAKINNAHMEMARRFGNESGAIVVTETNGILRVWEDSNKEPIHLVGGDSLISFIGDRRMIILTNGIDTYEDFILAINDMVTSHMSDNHVS